MHANACAAKASLSSIISISFIVKPALANALFEASTGPIPMILGSTPTTAELTILANGFKLYFFTASSDAIIVAAAPSFNPDEFPAVTLPPSALKAPLNLPNTSKDVFGFTNSSFENLIGSFFRCGISTVTISFAKRPFS